MNVEQLFSALTERLHGTASVKSVFGDPIETQGRTVIPVARVSYGFGAGMGSKGKDEAPEGEESGGGGGGGVNAVPLGVIEVSAKKTRFIPVNEPKKLAGAVCMGVMLGLALGRRKRIILEKKMREK